MEDLEAYGHVLNKTLPFENNKTDDTSFQVDNLRVTVISKDGEVTYDSDANEGEMDNHGSRPEIEDAFKTGEGEAVRRSQTMDKRCV